MLLCQYFINSSYLITEQTIKNHSMPEWRKGREERGRNKDKAETQTVRRKSGEQIPRSFQRRSPYGQDPTLTTEVLKLFSIVIYNQEGKIKQPEERYILDSQARNS